MSSPSVQRMLPKPRPSCVISGSLRSHESSGSPTLSTSSRGEVYFNDAFNHEGFGGSWSDCHEYDSIKPTQPKGPRKKTNYIYEPTMPSPSFPHRTQPNGPRKKTNNIYEPTMPSPSFPHRALRQDSESPSSHSSRSSSSSTDDNSSKQGRTHLSTFAMFLILVIFAISAAALALVILTINGTFGSKCVCTEQGNSLPLSTDVVTMQSLLQRILDLEKNMLKMKSKLETSDSAAGSSAKKQENQIKFLQNQVSAQGRLINETASKVDSVDCSSEKKLTAEIKLLNKSVTTLKNSNNEFKSVVNKLGQNHSLEKQITDSLVVKVTQLQSHVQELGQNHSLEKQITDSLVVKVTQLQSHVQELGRSSGNFSIRAGRLERGYAQITSVVNGLQAVNGAQNASRQGLQAAYKRLETSLAAVNAILKNKLNSSAAANFSACQYKVKIGTPFTPGGAGSVSYVEQSNKRVLGVTCSTDHAEEYKLSPQSAKGHYECTCSGTSQSASNIKRRKDVRVDYPHLRRSEGR